MNRFKTSKDNQRGVNLIELMVAITIGLILSGGVMSLFVSNRTTYSISEQLARVQENARFAIDAMARDIRMAGFMGCNNDIEQVFKGTTITPAAGDLWDTDFVIEGHDDAMGATWSPSGFATPGALVAGTDGITVRFLDGKLITPVIASGSGSLTAAENADVNINDEIFDFYNSPNGHSVFGVGHCGRTDILTVTAMNQDVDVDGSEDLFYAAGSIQGGYSGTLDQDDPEGNAMVAPVRAVRYYVGTGAWGGPSLFRQILTGGPAATDQELIEGVENMQLLYGLDNVTPADGAADAYADADAANLDNEGEWGRVMSVRIGLLLRTVSTAQADGTYGNVADTSTYNLFTGQKGCAVPADVGCVDPADLNLKRRVFTTTVTLRNQRVKPGRF